MSGKSILQSNIFVLALVHKNNSYLFKVFDLSTSPYILVYLQMQTATKIIYLLATSSFSSGSKLSVSSTASQIVAKGLPSEFLLVKICSFQNLQFCNIRLLRENLTAPNTRTHLKWGLQKAVTLLLTILSPRCRSEWAATESRTTRIQSYRSTCTRLLVSSKRRMACFVLRLVKTLLFKSAWNLWKKSLWKKFQAGGIKVIKRSEKNYQQNFDNLIGKRIGKNWYA